MAARRALASRVGLALAVGVAALFAAPAARANPPDVFGMGSRGASMASAVAADARDFSAVYYNPAGLADAAGPDLSIGYFRASHALAIDGKDNQIDPVRGLVGGFVIPGELAGVPFAFGVATHLPDDRISRVRTLRQDQPRWELYDNRSQLIYLGAALAVRPARWIEIGAGLTFLAATRGALDISGHAVLATPEDSQLRHEVDADLTAVRYPQAGVRVMPTDRIAFALVYRGQAQIKLDLNAELHGDVSAIGLQIPAGYTLDSHNLGAFVPRQVVLGSSVEPWTRVKVNVDLTWVQWSAYESPVSRSSAIIDVKLPPGVPLTIPPSPKPTQLLPPGFSDRIVPRIGVEWRAPAGEHVEIPVRAGYAFERSPVPPQTGVTNFVDADRHVLAAGVGVRLIAPIEELPGDVRLDTHAQLSLLPDRVTLKDNPADFVGDYRAGGRILALGATLSLGFR